MKNKNKKRRCEKGEFRQKDVGRCQMKKKNKLKHEKEEFSDNRLNIYMQECWLFECENYCKCAVNQASSSEEVQTEIIFINIASNCSDSGKILLWQQNQYQFEPIKKKKVEEKKKSWSNTRKIYI